MTVTATDNPAVVLISQNGADGDEGDVGENGTGLNDIRGSLLANPLLHIFKTNSLSTVSAPTNTDSDVTWTRASTATYIDRYGVIQTAAIDIPREEKTGFLIEGSSTNDCLHSEDFSNAAWLGPVVAVTNSTSAPDGAISADTLTPNASADNKFQIVTIAASADVHTFSVFIKQVNSTRTDIYIQMTDFYIVNIEWVDGVATEAPGSPIAPLITPLSDGWYRVAVTATNTLLSSSAVGFIFPDVVGTGSIYAWGSQLELGEQSSYIPTTISPVTRSADIVSLPYYNNFFDGGTVVYLDFEGVQQFPIITVTTTVDISAIVANGTVNDFRSYDFILNQDELDFLSGQ